MNLASQSEYCKGTAFPKKRQLPGLVSAQEHAFTLIERMWQPAHDSIEMTGSCYRIIEDWVWIMSGHSCTETWHFGYQKLLEWQLAIALQGIPARDQ